MRGQASPQSAMFSYVSLEERVPASHPLRKLRMLVDSVLASMDDEFDAIYARVGRPSVPPERLLKALLLQILFSIRSERLLVESLDYNLLYRWFVGLGIDDDIWDHSTFSQNRDRLFNEGLARIFFERVKALAQWGRLTSSEHFSVDGTLIEAWASHKSFKPRDGSGPPVGPGRNPEADFKGQRRINDTHASSTDPDAQLFRKSHGAEARLAHMSHVLMENRNGLVVDVDTTPANGTAEREAALRMIRRQCRRGATVGADKGYDTHDFVAGCRKAGVTPHVAAKRTGSALDGRTTRHAGYKSSLKVRKRIEEAFGWLKTVGGLRKTKLIGREKLAGQALLCFATYNLVRIGSLTGWWDAKHV
ncbi:IS5/IS1182 family transposase [Parazoarcus communis]|uniref:IS5/IS1182 family transposase n=1 Tax=Parazoarcus communis TaxID=41977 RepID=A0A2U8H109_9RHOO|nr:IS5 family transposase [Parazoarcus communis]AWI79581.1 IS5/IS1182 family transposase [Parazoarcus communis]